MFLFALTLTLALLPVSIAARGTQRIDAGGGGIRADEIQARNSNRGATRHQATWGLARISSGPSRLVNQDPLSRDFNYRFSPGSLGLGTQAFIIGTGCDVDIPDLSNNTPETHNRTLNIGTFPSGADGTDKNGLGTGLAAITGGQLVGVAPQARLLCIKVGDHLPQVKDLIDGIGLAVQRAANTSTPSVILLPFFAPVDQEYDDAVANAIEKGVPVIVSAGSGSVGKDVKGFSPTGVPGVITVSATDIGDRMPNSSNFGQNVTLLAPGINVILSDDDRVGFNSTQTSAAYVAGVALNLMSELGRRMSPDELKDRLVGLALKGVIQDIRPDTNNYLLNNGFAT